MLLDNVFVFVQTYIPVVDPRFDLTGAQLCQLGVPGVEGWGDVATNKC